VDLQEEFDRGDPQRHVARYAAQIREDIDATWPATPEERIDEELLASWAGWREAAGIANEATMGDYARAGRFQLAADIREARRGV
jgi:hypothetical protein